MTSIPLAENRSLEELDRENSWVWIFLLQLRPGLLERLIGRHHIFLPPLGSSGLLALRCQRLQRGRCVMDVDGAICGLVGMLQNANDGFADCWKGRRAEDAITAVEEVDALLFEVHAEADSHAPIEEGSRHDEGVSHPAGGCFFLECVLNYDLIFEDRKSSDFLVEGVAAEFGGDEVLDVGFGRGFNEEKLSGDDGGAEGGDDCILALKGVGERIERFVVNWGNGDGWRKAMGAGFAS